MFWFVYRRGSWRRSFDAKHFFVEICGWRGRMNCGLDHLWFCSLVEKFRRLLYEGISTNEGPSLDISERGQRSSEDDANAQPSVADNVGNWAGFIIGMVDFTSWLQMS